MKRRHFEQRKVKEEETWLKKLRKHSLPLNMLIGETRGPERMKTLLPISHVIAIVAILSSGCGHGGDYEQSIQTNREQKLVATLNEAELAKIIHIGMSKEALIGVLGQPISVMPTDDGLEAFDYIFDVPESTASSRSTVSGVSVFLKGGKVLRWSPVYRSTSEVSNGKGAIPVESKTNGTTGAEAVQSISFWIVSSNTITGGRFIDTEKLPKLGYVPSDPAMSLKRLKSLYERQAAGTETPGKGPVERYELSVIMMDEDAVVFKKLTEENHRRRILVMVGNRPVIAPYIIAPVSSGVIRLPCDSSQELDEMRDKLRKLLPPQ